MLDDATIAAIKGTIGTIGGTLDSVLGAADPALHVPIVLGTVVAQQAPQLVADVEEWLAKAKSGQAPTDAENAAIAAKIGALLVPENNDPNLA